MAKPKKKPKKTYKGPKTASNSPNKVLVIFLVFFIVLSIVLGLLVYQGFNAAEDAMAKTDDANKAKASAEKEKEFYAVLAREARAAVGAPFKQDENIDEQNHWTIGREELLTGSKYNQEPLYEVSKAWLEQNNKILGFNDKTKSFNTTLTQQITKLQNDLTKAKADETQARTARNDLQKKYNDLATKYQQWRDEFVKDVEKKHQLVLNSVQEQTDQFMAVRDVNQTLKNKLDEQRLDTLAKMREKDKIINDLVAKLEEVQARPQGVGEENGEQQAVGGGQPLFLDISKGRPLWDRPKGRVTKVLPNERKVYVNIGSAQGVKPELTFNVFSPGTKGRAEGFLRGTIEIQQVIDANTSIGKITSMFDENGKEVPMFDPRIGHAQRASANPIQEGDQLYNMFWKTRVALAGKLNLSGVPTFAASQELRNLQLFMDQLENQGIKVDAYLDPTEGQVKGELKPTTQFLIIGDRFVTEDKILPDAKTAEPEELDKKVEAMATEAFKRGLFVISAENFMNVIGYRPPRSADSTATGFFEPRPPFFIEPQMKNGAKNGNNKEP